MSKAILTIGIQGTGKSTYAKELASLNPEMKQLNKDELRFLMFDTHTYRDNYEPLHAQFGIYLDYIYWTMAQVIIEQGLTIILDETHYTEKRRKDAIQLLRDIDPGIKIEAHYLPIELPLALERNAQRRPEQVVPEEVIRQHNRELLASLGGSWGLWDVVDKLTNEGFDNVVVKNR